MADDAAKFRRWKAACLNSVDLSKKGSIDFNIVDLVEYINGHHRYFTTSSCSGRICLFSEDNEMGLKKKGCRWLYTTHESADAEKVKEALSCIQDEAVFKFEPFVLHVQCMTLQDARVMHQVAIESGFRNSGISVGKSGKVIMAVRSTHGLEVPIATQGKVLVSTEYIEYIVKLANDKMKENSRRIDRFFSNMKTHLSEQSEQVRQDGIMSTCRTCGRQQTDNQSQKEKKKGQFKIHQDMTPKIDKLDCREQTNESDDSDGINNLEDIGTLFST
ncbi:tRNA wybutosine-synthesizing protein 3 homolog [Glandiceps talaboti]